MNDLPELSTTFAQYHQLDLKRRILLNGIESDVLELANVLNVRISETDTATSTTPTLFTRKQQKKP